MIRKFVIPFAGASLVLAASVLLSSSTALAAQKKKANFASVQPLIKAKCAGCHNATRHPEGVDCSSYAAIMKGGEKGKLVIPGKPDESPFILYVTGKLKPQMPLGPNGPLKPAEVNSLKAWIAAGAKS